MFISIVDLHKKVFSSRQTYILSRHHCVYLTHLERIVGALHNGETIQGELTISLQIDVESLQELALLWITKNSTTLFSMTLLSNMAFV